MDEIIQKRREEYGKGKWLVFKDIQVGMEFPTVAFEVTGELIEKYCRAMGDAQALYSDEKAARKEGYERTIAPATIVCIYAIPSALLSGYVPKVIPPPGNIHFRQEYEFFSPAGAGDTIRINSKVVAKEVRKQRYYVTIESEYINQTGKKIAVGRITPIWSR
ncbi:MAG: MaoC family dehydratase [Desulfobacterales bacterium]|nr:MaoC family dehydratase [Desulfobacterales bacterium]